MSPARRHNAGCALEGPRPPELGEDLCLARPLLGDGMLGTPEHSSEQVRKVTPRERGHGSPSKGEGGVGAGSGRASFPWW